MEIVLVWNNAQSFKKHVADMKDFNEKHKNLFKQEMGKELIQLGYEKDLNW